MYNVPTVTETLLGLVGFRQPGLARIDPIDNDLTLSRSGLYIDGAHELITASNLQGAAVAENADSERVAYTSGTYKKNDVVFDSAGSYLYRSLAENNTAALTDTTKWAKTSLLSILLRRVITDAVADVLSAVRTRKLQRLEGKTRINKTMLYDEQGNVADSITPTGRFVAIRITPTPTDAAIILSSLGIQFTGHVTDLPIYVYGDDDAYISRQLVSTTYGGRFAWPVSWEPLRVSGSNRYYVGYYEDDLPEGVQAIRRNRTIGKVCAGCNTVSFALYNKWSPYVSIDVVRVDPVELNVDRTRWDIDAEDVVENQNYGLNLSIAVECDITNILVQQAGVFSEALRQQIVVKLLNAIAFSTITSGIEQAIREKAMFALKNTEEPKLDKMLDALDIELSGLSLDCLPETGTQGMIRKKTVWSRK